MSALQEAIKKYKDLPKIIGVLVVLMSAWKVFDFYTNKGDAIMRKIAKEEAEKHYILKEKEFVKVVNDFANKKIYSPMYSFAENYTLLDSLKHYLPVISKIGSNKKIIINVKVLDKSTGKMYFIDKYGNEYPLHHYSHGNIKGHDAYIDEKLKVLP